MAMLCDKSYIISIWQALGQACNRLAADGNQGTKTAQPGKQTLQLQVHKFLDHVGKHTVLICCFLTEGTPEDRQRAIADQGNHVSLAPELT